MKKLTIIENAEELEVTDAEAAELEQRGLIYHCPPEGGGHFEDGTGCGFLHTHDDGWEKVDAALDEIRTKAGVGKEGA